MNISNGKIINFKVLTCYYRVLQFFFNLEAIHIIIYWILYNEIVTIYDLHI